MDSNPLHTLCDQISPESGNPTPSAQSLVQSHRERGFHLRLLEPGLVPPALRALGVEVEGGAVGGEVVPRVGVDQLSKFTESLRWFRLVVLLLWVRTVDTSVFVQHRADAAVEVLGLVVVPSLCPILSLGVGVATFKPEEMDRPLIVIGSIENTCNFAVFVYVAAEVEITKQVIISLGKLPVPGPTEFILGACDTGE